LGKIFAIIVAAGKGLRMSLDTPKQYILLHNKHILRYTIEVFDAIESIDEIIVAVPESDLEFVQKTILERPKFNKNTIAIAGGQTRQESVYNALSYLPIDTEIVLIHDGVRPFVSKDTIINIINEVKVHNAVVVGVGVKDTIKVIDESGFVKETLNREHLSSIQTPQAFKYELIYSAHKKAIAEDFVGTDDSILVERMNVPVKIIPGSYNNLKITTFEDLLLAKEMIKEKGDI